MRRIFDDWVVTNPFAGLERQPSEEDNARWDRRKNRWKVFEEWCGRKIDRMTPPGFQWMPLVNWSVAGMGVCSIISLFRFGKRYGSAWRALEWVYVQHSVNIPVEESTWLPRMRQTIGEWIRISDWSPVIKGGEIFSSFSWMMEGVMAPFLYLMAIIMLMVIFHYLYYYYESKSIYLMKRLPKRIEIHRRSFALPLTLVALCLMMTLLLSMIYFGWYHLWIPGRCIEPGQLGQFLREGIFTMWRGDGL